MRDFETFKNTVKDLIKDYLPDDYEDAKVEIRDNEKLNESYTGLTVSREDDYVTPTINLDKLYEAYESGELKMSEVMMKAAEMVEMKPQNLDVGKLMDYEAAKENLFIRVSGLENNRELVENAPHTIVEDMVITYHVAASIEGDSIASTMVNNQLMNTYGVTKEQLHADAIANSEKLFPAHVESMADTMKRIISEDMRDSGMSEEEIDTMLEQMGIEISNPMTVVTNDQAINGAAVLFYPGQMDKLTEKMEGDFFVLPSSLHECIVIPDTGDFSHQDLKAMVTEINATQVAPQDQLTDEVYHYDSKDRVFEKAASFDERQKNKALAKVSENSKSYGNNHEKDVAQPKKDEAQQGAKPKRKSQDMSL